MSQSVSVEDGVYRVRTNNLCAGFVIQGGKVVACAPILRRQFSYWLRQAKWIAPMPVIFSEKGGRHSTIHHWPSNFFIEPDGTHVEGEFQAEKYRLAGRPFYIAVVKRKPPAEAKRLGSKRKLKMTEDQIIEWNDKRVDIMLELVRRKFTDHPELAAKLIATGNQELVEDNWWHDNFWGNCTCINCFHSGQNWLGETLMQVRRELHEQIR